MHCARSARHPCTFVLLGIRRNYALRHSATCKPNTRSDALAIFTRIFGVLLVAFIMEAHLTKLRQLIEELLELSGSPGLSLGVLHHGVPAYTAHLGRQRSSQAVRPNDDTLYNVASLTKLMTAGVVSNLVEQGLLDWDAPVRHYLPELEERKDDVGQHATCADLLANRTGLSAQNTFWGVMFEDILTHREQIPAMACHIPAMGEFRNTFVYSAWGYAIVTSAIERVTGEPFSACVEKYVFQPLGMSRSTTSLPTVENTVYKHWVDLDGVAHEFPWSEYRGWSDDTGFGGAVGARSSTSELLTMYQSLLHAYDHQIKNGVDSTPGSPFKYARKLLCPHVSIGNAPSGRQAYCLGAYRTQLPGNLSFASFNSMLWKEASQQTFGDGHDGRMVFHQAANFTGYSGFMFLDLQTQSAVVVLTNSLPLFDITNIVGQLIFGTLLGKIDSSGYMELARSVKKANMRFYGAITSGLEKRRSGTSSARPLRDYQGEYWNGTGMICYSVQVHDDNSLQVTPKGSHLTNYILEPWGGNVFCLPPNRDLELSQSMWLFTPLKARVFTFNGSEGKVMSFTWHHDPTPGSGPETFVKATQTSHARL
jgi:CubicO group peptidase (beta-lactamase class C family)